MARELNQKEKENIIENREALHHELSELQADFEDLSDEELIECRETMLSRINRCMMLILETNQDNIKN